MTTYDLSDFFNPKQLHFANIFRTLFLITTSINKLEYGFVSFTTFVQTIIALEYFK